MKRRHYIVSYDIADPKRLKKVAKIMEDFGMRVLYSVFECYLDQFELNTLRQTVEPLLDPLEDSVRYYVLCERCKQKIEHIGREKRFLQPKDIEIF